MHKKNIFSINNDKNFNLPKKEFLIIANTTSFYLCEIPIFRGFSKKWRPLVFERQENKSKAMGKGSVYCYHEFPSYLFIYC